MINKIARVCSKLETQEPKIFRRTLLAIRRFIVQLETIKSVLTALNMILASLLFFKIESHSHDQKVKSRLLEVNSMPEETRKPKRRFERLI